MFRINPKTNSIVPLISRKFGELGFGNATTFRSGSRKLHLVGEELLIIQKEFSGFSDTNERLDLLAVDKHGSLVLIENKLDDTGRDVTWQALKYPSYCSRLSKENIRHIYQDFLEKTEPGADAKEKLREFLDADDYEEI